MKKPKFENVVTFVIVTFLVLMVVLGIGYLVYDEHRVNQINDDFTNTCTKRGGETIIDDKNLCVKDGRILFHE